MLTTLLLCQNSIVLAQTKNEPGKNEIIKEQWDELKPSSEGKTVTTPPVKSVDSPSMVKSAGYDYVDVSSEEGKVIVKDIIPSVPKEFEGKITLRAENVPLKIILKSIGKATGYNIVFGPHINQSQPVSINSDDVEIWRALNTILFPLSYGFRLRNNDLVILAEETRVYRISLPPVSSNINDLTSNESFVTSQNNESSNNNQNKNSSLNIRVGTKILVENKLDKLSLWDDIEDNLKSILTQNGKYSLNKPAGVILVSDLPSNLDKIDGYFNEINSRISQQIQVDVKVVEVKFTDQKTMGVDWAALTKSLGELNKLSLASNFASNAFNSGNFSTLTLTGSNPDSGTTENGINLVIKALEEYGSVEVVSQPKIALLNNTAAIIQVGTTRAFVDNSTVQTTQTGTITTLSTSQVQEGVTMRIMGNTVNDKIFLNVVPVVTTIDSIRKVTSGNTTLEAPTTTTKSINTMVKVQEGQTVAIGGLITADNAYSRDGIPGLSRLPVLGGLFSSTTKKKNRTELIVFITPKRIN